jgi:hypothetical protein
MRGRAPWIVGVVSVSAVAVGCKYDPNRIPVHDPDASTRGDSPDAGPGAKGDHRNGQRSNGDAGSGLPLDASAGAESTSLEDHSVGVTLADASSRRSSGSVDGAGGRADASETAPPCSDGSSLRDGGCVADDPCAARGLQCTQPARCEGKGGDARCACAPGYVERDGGVCEDVDECAAANECAANAFCRNEPGSYSCRCAAYYTEALGGRRCDDKRLEWAFTASLRGILAMPFGSELLLAATFAGYQLFSGVAIATAGDQDILLARLDAQRSLSWKRRFGGPLDDVLFWANLDSAGNWLLTGYTDGGLDFGAGAIPTDGRRARFVTKLRGTDGSLVWSRALYNVDRTPAETPSWEADPQWEGFVVADASDDVLLAGRFHDTLSIDSTTLVSAGGWDMFLAKFSPDGVLLWARGWGGAGDDYLRAVVPGVQGEIFVAGTFDQSLQFGEATLTPLGGRDVLLARLDGEGVPTWSRQMGGKSDDLCGRMAVGPDGNPILAGEFSGAASFGTPERYEALGSKDAWIAKWSRDGTALWSHRIGGVANDVIWGVASGPSSEAVVSGFFQDRVDFGEGVRSSRGSSDAFVVKYGADGAFQWARDFGGAGYDTSGTVRTDATGRVYPVGWYQAPADLGFGNLAESGMYLLQLSP